MTIPRRSGTALTALSAVGLGIASYLAITKLSGGIPVCGPLRGCETVNTSPYSEVFGVPVALFGVLFSVLLLAASVTWWRGGDRRALYAAYGLGLAGIVAVAYLTYLELFVIEAVCVWCVAYAVTVVAGSIVAAVALRATH